MQITYAKWQRLRKKELQYIGDIVTVVFLLACMFFPELSATAVNHPLGSLDVKGVTILTPAVAKSFRGFNIFSYSSVRSVHTAPIKERGKGDQAE